jgi:hypothetical protein
VVALGASNLTRGFHSVVATARGAWGPDVEVLAALGHGRSYGVPSRVLVRTLPGILDSGLWQELDRRPAAATRAIVTDVGNDILYGFSAEQVLAWVEAAVLRLQRATADIVLTELPMASIRRLSGAQFLVFRSIFVPSCRLSRASVLATAERVDAGIAALATRHGLRLQHLDRNWYGLDPIHIRSSVWPQAWPQILGVPSLVARPSRSEWLRLYLQPPEHQWLCGVERRHPQLGRRLTAGGQVWLY